MLTVTFNSNTTTYTVSIKAILDGAVSISGTHTFGQTLTAVTDALATDPPGADVGTLYYQWTRDGTDIAGATSSTYELAADDIGTIINVKVTA